MTSFGKGISVAIVGFLILYIITEVYRSLQEEKKGNHPFLIS